MSIEKRRKYLPNVHIERRERLQFGKRETESRREDNKREIECVEQHSEKEEGRFWSEIYVNVTHKGQLNTLLRVQGCCCAASNSTTKRESTTPERGRVMKNEGGGGKENYWMGRGRRTRKNGTKLRDNITFPSLAVPLLLFLVELSLCVECVYSTYCFFRTYTFCTFFSRFSKKIY